MIKTPVKHEVVNCAIIIIEFLSIYAGLIVCTTLNLANSKQYMLSIKSTYDKHTI